jgi:hypothetical protein
MSIKFENLKILYPDNFSAIDPKPIESIPDVESFVGQVYFIRGILIKYGIRKIANPYPRKKFPYENPITKEF